MSLFACFFFGIQHVSNVQSSVLTIPGSLRLLLGMVFWGAVLVGTCVAQTERPRIEGPRVVISPEFREYRARPAQDYAFEWRTRGEGIRLTTADGDRAFFQITSSGVDTIILRYRHRITQATGTDTFRVFSNRCRAVMGQISPDQAVCVGNRTTVSIDTLVGETFYWEFSNTSRGPWVPVFREERVYTTPYINATTWFRAIVRAGSCRDTSELTRVEAGPFPAGDFPNAPASVCAGDTTAPLNAVLEKGTGHWETSGQGTFTDTMRPDARYVPALADSGTVTLTWHIRSADCPSLTFSQPLEVRPAPEGRFSPLDSLEVCPRNVTEVLEVAAARGTGSWEPVPLGGIERLGPGRYRYYAPTAARGQQIPLTWRVEGGGCRPRKYTQVIEVREAGVADILNNSPEQVCRGGSIQLEARRDPRFRGFYFWGGQQPLDDPTIFNPIARPRSNGRYILTFYDDLTNCISRDTIEVEVVEELVLEVQDNITRCRGELLNLNTLLSDSSGQITWQRQVYDPVADSIRFQPLPGSVVRADTTVQFRFIRRARECRQDGQVRLNVRYTQAEIQVPFPNFRGFCRGDNGVLRLEEITTRPGGQCHNRYWFGTRSDQVLRAELIDPVTGALDSSRLTGPGTVLLREGLEIPVSTAATYPVNTSPQDFDPNRSLEVCTVCWDSVLACLVFDDIRFRILQVPQPEFRIAIDGEPLNPRREVPFGERDQIQFRNETVELEANAEYLYAWDFGDPESGDDNFSQDVSPAHSYSRSGRFTITLVASNGACSRSTTRSFTVLEEQYFFPNAFSPNNDGRNDRFRPIPAYWEGTDAEIDELPNEIDMQIFDTRGNLVFETREMRGWDGRDLNDAPLAAGTYTFKVVIFKAQEGNEPLTYTGAVTLIR